MNQRREGFIYGLGNEPVEGCYSLGQTLYLLGYAQRPHIYEGLYLLRVGFYASLVDHKPKKFFKGHAKCELEWVQLHAISP